MPLQKLTYRAGINREGTDYSNEGGFYDGDKVRFRSGQAEFHTNRLLMRS